jgi:succinate dehydrogenase/fumarate reductase flavoprotein subunit
VRLEALDDALMIRSLPGVFCAGEMLDWEAPTGGYLLSACFASGRRAGLGAVEWLRSHGYADPAAGMSPAQGGDGNPSNGEAIR